MAKKPKAEVKVPGVDEIDPEATYSVTLKRSVVYSGVNLSPKNEVTVSGKALIEIADAVKHATAQS